MINFEDKGKKPKKDPNPVDPKKVAKKATNTLLSTSLLFHALGFGNNGPHEDTAIKPKNTAVVEQTDPYASRHHTPKILKHPTAHTTRDGDGSNASSPHESGHEMPHIEPHEVPHMTLPGQSHHQGLGAQHNSNIDLPTDSGSDSGTNTDSGQSISSGDSGSDDATIKKDKNKNDKRNSSQNPFIVSREEELSKDEKKFINTILQKLAKLMLYFKRNELSRTDPTTEDVDSERNRIKEIAELLDAIGELRDVFYETPHKISKQVLSHVDDYNIPVHDAIDNAVFELLFAKHGDFYLVEDEKNRLRQFLKIAMHCEADGISPEETFKVLTKFNDGHWAV